MDSIELQTTCHSENIVHVGCCHSCEKKDKCLLSIMGVNCGKGFLYFYNLIFLGIAGGLMYLSVLYVWKWGDYTTLVANTYSIVPVGIIFVFGVVVCITAVVGCCGTCNESRCTLGVFFSLLLIILAMEIVAGTLFYVKKTEINSELESNLWSGFYQYYDEHSTTNKAFDKMQNQLKCCGVKNYFDWQNVSKKEIPESCCIHPGNRCYDLLDNVYTDGCYNALILELYTSLQYIIGVMISFGVLQVFGMILGVYLMVALRRSGYIRVEALPTS